MVSTYFAGGQSKGQDICYTYYATGYIQSATDVSAGTRSEYGVSVQPPHLCPRSYGDPSIRPWLRGTDGSCLARFTLRKMEHFATNSYGCLPPPRCGFDLPRGSTTK